MFIVNGQQVSGLVAEAKYIEWCLSLVNENQPVPRSAHAAARARIWQAGIFLAHQ